MSTAPHLWRKLLDARKAGARIVVVDPFRSRTARVADEHLRPLPGTDAALGTGHDAGDRRRRAPGRGLVPRARRGIRRAARASWTTSRSSGRPRSAASTPRRSRGWAASSPRRGRRCCGSAWARSAISARPRRTRRSPRCRRSPAPGASAAEAAHTSRLRPPRPCPSTRCRAPSCGRARCGRSTCRRSAKP